MVLEVAKLASPLDTFEGQETTRRPQAFFQTGTELSSRFPSRSKTAGWLL